MSNTKLNRPKDIYQEAIETFGKDMQLTVAVEELSELTKEICKHKRGADNKENIIEEMADVYIMLSQLEIIFGISFGDVYRMVEYKVKRLQERIQPRKAVCRNDK